MPILARPPHPRFTPLAFALVMACCAPAHLVAEPHPPAEYTLREWHEQDGLPSDELAGVAQDGQGFLCVATNTGLARFDGTAFESVVLEAEIHTRGLVALANARADRPSILAAPAVDATQHAAGIVTMRDGAWRFEAESVLAGKLPRSVFGARDGAIWTGCDDGTILRRHGDDCELHAAPADLAARKPAAFASDATGQVWIARGSQLFRVTGGQWQESPMGSQEPELRIVSSKTGGIWLLTRGALRRWDGAGFAEIAPLPELLGAHFIQTALEDSHGFLWIGTRSQGLFRIVGPEIKPVPTSSENVTGVCEDADGNIWAATNGGGLSRLRAKAHRLFDQSSGLTDNFSYTVAGDSSGTIWLANRDGGMARFKDGLIDTISRRAGWRPFSTMSVTPAPNGSIWMTTGLGVFRTVPGAPETAERVTSLSHLRNIRSTFVARNGDYWLAVDPDRVARWRDDQVVTFGPTEGFDGREVRAFAEDAAGHLWLGAADGRLYRSNGDRFERVPFRDSENCGALQVIRFTPDGSILIGTTRYGVIVIPGGDFSRQLALFSDHGLPGNNITQILIDDHDRHWFAARSGIFWVHGRHVRDFAAGKAARVHAITLGKDDGLPYLGCLGLFQPAAWKAQDGTLWFATRRGVLRTDPAIMASGRDTPPPVAITSISCDGHAQSLDTTMRIQSTVRRIELRLSALDLSAPASVQVRFRLDGFDSDWGVQGDERVVIYPRLPPGRYVFSTMASNGSGAWSSQPALLTIIVVPPWWQSIWARLATLLALVATVGAAVRKWSHRRLRLRLERSEQARAIERERARIARNIHDDVGASLTRISLLTQAAQQEDPAHAPALEKIYEATHAITRSMDEIVWAVNPRYDNTESLVYYLGNFAQNFLGAAGIRCRLESPGELPEAPLTSQIRHVLFLCCKEALNNVVKHAGATAATLSIAMRASSLVVAISDNGRGISPARPASPDPLRSSPGNGLRNMEQRMAEIHGACTILPGPHGGTTVTLTVPTPPAAGV